MGSRKGHNRICRYSHCKHKSREIDLRYDDYKVEGSMYYHPDCFKAKKNGEWKTDAQKSDLLYIKDAWVEHISDKVPFWQLYQVLNELLERGIDSEYMVFAMDYIIGHKLNLHYPKGFPYFLDRQEIKEAYEKVKAKEELRRQGYNKKSFTTENKKDTSPKFSVSKKPKGFQRILESNKE